MLLQELIQIPSVNPDGLAPELAHITGEKRIANFLTAYLTELGAEVILEEIEDDRPNLIARFAPMDGRPRILLGPHMDTVPIANMTIEPFSGEIRDGKIWGRGASDTKGPMAAMLHGLAKNRDILADLSIAVDFVAFMGEETSQLGSKHFAKHHGHEYQFAVVGEPTSLQVVNVTKGSAWITVSTTGVSTHASQPELGENAILKLAKSLVTLQESLEPSLNAFQHEILGRSTINIGTITGGNQPNIVPNSASAEIDIRQTPDLWKAGGAVKLLRDHVKTLNLPLNIECDHENPPMETEANNPFIKRLTAIGSVTSIAGAPWFSDAAHLSAAGIPSICIGPGSINQAHTKDEFISLEDLKNGEDFFAVFIKSLAE